MEPALWRGRIKPRSVSVSITAATNNRFGARPKKVLADGGGSWPVVPPTGTRPVAGRFSANGLFGCGRSPR